MASDIKLREEMARAWLDDLAYVRDQFKGKMHRDLNESLLYIQDLAGFGVPAAKEGKWGLTHWPAKYETVFYFVPLLEEDVKLHHYFGELIKSASYNEVSKAVFLPPWKMSRSWRTIILEHELMHVIAHNAGWHRRKKLAMWAEEYEVYRAEAYLASRIYGRKYTYAVKRLAKKFAIAIKTNQLLINDDVAPRALIERIFGLPHSDYERKSQRGLLILDALYHALDLLYKPGGRRHDMHCRTITFWFCRPAEYKKWRESQRK